MSRNGWFRRAALILTVAGLPNAARAVTLCGVSVSSLAFGTYDPFASTPTTATATVTVSCTLAIGASDSWTVSLSTGLSGTYANRTMTELVNSLAYQVYVDAGHSMVWGDGTAGTTINSGSYSAAIIGSTTVNYTAYGQIAARQNIVFGVFADVLLVTLTY